MKKLFSIVAMATMLFATSCSDEEQGGLQQSGEVDVTFEVGLPDGFETRAISDGKTAKTLSWAVYEAGKTVPLAVLAEDGTTFTSSRYATFNIKLLTEKSYDIIFWADSKDSPYTFDMGTQSFSFKDGATVLANDENRDAFYAVLKGFSFTGKQEQVTLSRPFAQVNFGTDDMALVTDQFEVSESKVVIENAYTGMNLMTGEPVGEAAAVTYDFAAIPGASEKFPINPETHKYLATAYVIVPADKSVVKAGFTAKSTANGERGDTYENVPVQRNYRTNIYGSLITKNQGYKVTISPNYEGNLVTDGTSFQKAIAQGGDIVLANDIQTGSLSFSTTKPTNIDLNGHTLDLNFASSKIIGEGADVTFKNGTIVNTKLNSPSSSLIGIESNSSLTLENATLEVPNASALHPRGDAARVTVKNSTIKANIYAIATNAAKMENYGVIIDLTGSTFEGQPLCL